MTREKLRQLYYLNREIINDTEELVELKIKARKSKKAGKEKLIAEQERRLVEKIRRCKSLKKEINEFIDGIEDSLMRQIMYYRYAKGMSWSKVAFMTGGGNTENGVRMAATRFLKRLDTEK